MSEDFRGSPHLDTTGEGARKLMRYDANKKSLGIAYALWFFLGGLGAHRFYMGRTGTAIVMAALLIIGLAILVTLVPLGIWMLIDAFLLPGWVRDHNNALAENL